MDRGHSRCFVHRGIPAAIKSSRPALAYALSFFGVVDLLAILPFYLTTGIDLRAVKVLRALRIISLLKLTRYNAAMNRFARCFRFGKRGICLVCYCDNDDLVLGGGGYLLL